MKKQLIFGALASIALAAQSAQAGTYFVLVTDMSKLQWHIDAAGVVWLRNLSSFDSAVLGCCYNFSVDTTTAAGKSIWASMLAKIETAQPLWIGLSNGNASPGPVGYVGNW